MRRVSFPRLGPYNVVFRPIAGLLGEVVPPQPITRHTVELGAAHSPDAACLPFKHTLGTFMEALEAGADVLMQAGGGCRLGYYGEVQEQILRDMGYRFELLSLTTANAGTIRALARTFRRMNRRLGYREMARTFALAAKKLEILDDALTTVRRDRGFAVDAHAYQQLAGAFVSALDDASDVIGVDDVAATFREAFAAAPMRPRDDALRVGVVGEFYVAIEPFANSDLDGLLAGHGVEVHRPVTLSSVFDADFGGADHMSEILKDASPFLRFEVGTDGTKAVAHAARYQREGFDGVVHVRPFGCIPEVNVLPALQRLSLEREFPIMSLSFDTQTADAGVRTRVEAFCDMLRMRRSRPSTRAEVRS